MSQLSSESAKTFTSPDLRDYLRQQFSARAKRNPRYSLRAFARDLKLAPSTLSEVLNGKTNLTRKTVQKFFERLDCTDQEKTHLMDLASLNDASPLIRNEAIARIRERLKDDFYFHLDRNESCRIQLNFDHYLIFTICLINPNGTSQSSIKSKSKLSSKRVQKVTEELLNWGVIAKREELFFATKEALRFETGEASVTLREIYRALLKRAEDAIEKQSLDEREFGFSLMAISKKDLPRFKVRLRQFSDEITKEFTASSDKDAVYGYFSQFFRLDSSQ